MNSDSKKKSSEANTDLCLILTDVIKKRKAIEKSVGAYIRDYPDFIYNTEPLGYYANLGTLPSVIECNDEDFTFDMTWLDTDYEAYFNELKRKEIGAITHVINNVLISLQKHNEKIASLNKLTFNDIEL
jgi:hypothetical protein